jgi:hypothetical protein
VPLFALCAQTAYAHQTHAGLREFPRAGNILARVVTHTPTVIEADQAIDIQDIITPLNNDAFSMPRGPEHPIITTWCRELRHAEECVLIRHG